MTSMRRTDIVKIYRRFKDDQNKEIEQLKRDVRDLRMLIGLIAEKVEWDD